jgi:uncharacterized protein YbjQ (UPF0145 family)
MIDLARAMAALQAAPASGREAPSGATSSLSIDETLLLQAIGWEPVDLVFGISWWSVPWGSWQWQTGEIAAASDAFAGAMDEATAQLREECGRVGGTGVVGVEIDLRVRSHRVAVGLTGTAVRRGGPRRQGPAFVSDLSARDFALLTRAGWMPLDLVAGASFVQAPRRSARQWASQQGQNLELPHLTEALYLARERAMERMQQLGLAAGAEGIVAVKLAEGPLTHQTRVMQFVAIGTAVRLAGDQHRRLEPQLVTPLDDRVVRFQASSLRGA